MTPLKPLDDQNYDASTAKSDHPAVIFFFAPWSRPCDGTKEVLVELAGHYQERISFFCMNIDENANIPASLGVKTIPSLFAIEDGRVTKRLTGRNPKVKIREFIERLDHGSQSPG